MARCELSKAAEKDIDDILDYSYREFGEKVATEYFISLKETFELIADQPRLGTAVDDIRVGYYRHEHARHSIFYILQDQRVLIVRVLHESMDFERHL